MPKRYKPQLQHQTVSYRVVADWLFEELWANRVAVLGSLGCTGEADEHSVINEIAGLLTNAVMISLNAGFKPARQVIATLQAIIENPELAFAETTEPEARGVLAAHYQRGPEPPGTFWMDILEECASKPDHQQIISAATRAKDCLEKDVERGRPIAQHIQYLAPRLRRMFLRFNETIKRKSEITSQGCGRIKQVESGDFCKFLHEIFAPIHSLFSDRRTKELKLSAAYITRVVTDVTLPKMFLRVPDFAPTPA